MAAQILTHPSIWILGTRPKKADKSADDSNEAE
jgi:hypothetical protein